MSGLLLIHLYRIKADPEAERALYPVNIAMSLGQLVNWPICVIFWLQLLVCVSVTPLFYIK